MQRRRRGRTTLGHDWSQMRAGIGSLKRGNAVILSRHLKPPILNIAVALLMGGCLAPVAAADSLPAAPTYIPGTRITPEIGQPPQAGPEESGEAEAPAGPAGASTAGEAVPGSLAPMTADAAGLQQGTGLDALDPYIPQPGKWSLIPGTSIAPVLPTETELGADFCAQISCQSAMSVLTAWNAIGYDEASHCLWALAGGGHADYGGNETYRFCLGAPLAGWERVTNPAPLSNAATCPAPVQGPMSSHTYDGVVWIPGTAKFLWLGTAGFCRHGMGPNSVWIFDSSTAGWTELPHLRQYAKHARTGIDPRSGDILVFTRNTLLAVDSTSFQVKWATRPTADLGDGNAIVHPQRREFYLLGKGALYSAKLDVPPEKIKVRKIADLPEIESRQMGMAVHDPTGDIILWDGKSTTYAYDPERQSLEVLSPPTGPAPSARNPGRVYSQWQYVREKDVFVGLSPTEGIWLWRRGAGPSDGQVGSAGSIVQAQAASAIGLPEDQGLTGAQGTPAPASSDSPPPAADFATRRTAPGVIFAQGFDAPIPQSTNLRAPEAVGLNGEQIGQPTAVLPYVENGAMKFEIKSGSFGAGAGQYYVQFSDPAFLGRELTEDDALFVQWRQFIPKELLHTAFEDTKDGLTSFKMLIVSDSGTSSCTANHIVVVKDNWNGVNDPVGGDVRGSLALYHACGYYDQVSRAGPILGGSTLFDYQPIIAEADQPAVQADMIAHNRVKPGGPSTGRQCWHTGHERSGCVEMQAGTWVTYQVSREITGPSYRVGSHKFWPARLRLWQQVDGEANELVIDSILGMRAQDRGYGRAWFLPYMTNKDPNQVHPDTYTLVDEVIISTRRIPDRSGP